MNFPPDPANPFRSSGAVNPVLSPQNSTTVIPKTVGILHIVFASLMLLGGGCGGIYVLALSFMGPFFEAQQKEMHSAIENQREAELADLAEAERAKLTEEERMELENRREELKNRPIPITPDMSKMFSAFNEPRIMGYVWTDLLSGLILNLAMFITGIGLLRRRQWARTAGLWIAGIKVVRLIAVYTYYIVEVVPASVKMLIDMLKDFAEAGTPGMEPDKLDAAAANYTTMYNAYGVAMIIVGAIYPIVTLWLLTRPQVKAVCTK